MIGQQISPCKIVKNLKHELLYAPQGLQTAGKRSQSQRALREIPRPLERR